MDEHKGWLDDAPKGKCPHCEKGWMYPRMAQVGGQTQIYYRCAYCGRQTERAATAVESLKNAGIEPVAKRKNKDKGDLVMETNEAVKETPKAPFSDAALKALCDAKQKKINELNAQICDLKNRLADAQTRTGDESSERERLNNQILQLTQQNRALDEECQMLTSQNQELAEKLQNRDKGVSAAGKREQIIGILLGDKLELIDRILA